MQAFRVAGNFILEWVAVIIVVLVHPFNFMAEIYAKRKSRGVLREASKQSFSNAVELDKYFNKHYETLWNLTFKKQIDYAHKFGQNETLSEAMQRNKERNTLSHFGTFWYYIIIIADFTSWSKGGHFKNL